MEPQFQSSFIPKGAPSVSGAMPSSRRVSTQRDIVSLVAVGIFVISLLLALGVFLYGFFLNYRITQMGAQLEEARAALAPETVMELVDLNSRLVSTESLIQRHRIISPLFKFLEAATPKTVRYTEFGFTVTNKGLELDMRGAASSYTSLAAAAEVVNKNPLLKESVFSDLSLDDKGRVMFSLRALVDPQLLSYTRSIESSNLGTPSTQQAKTTPATSTVQTIATTSAKTTATTTKPTSTSTKPFGL